MEFCFLLSCKAKSTHRHTDTYTDLHTLVINFRLRQEVINVANLIFFVFSTQALDQQVMTTVDLRLPLIAYPFSEFVTDFYFDLDLYFEFDFGLGLGLKIHFDFAYDTNLVFHALIVLNLSATSRSQEKGQNPFF